MPSVSRILIGVGALLVAMQLVRCEQTNPKITGEVAAPADVQAMLKRSCYDCHSNETRWPWYSQVAPVSWLVHHDVMEGREHLNFSEWNQLSADKRKHKLEEIEELVNDGDMPLAYYLPLHSDARLSDADKQAIVSWSKQARATPSPP
jgi:hypothetical protein